jgi:hypothetical protein
VVLLFRVWVSLVVGWPVWCLGCFQAVISLTGVEPLSESCSVSPAGTGLTGGAHRSDRCGSVDLRFGVPLRSRVGRLCVGSYVQWHSSGYVGLTNLGSELEKCVGSRVHLVRVSISFEKNFYRLPFTPPPLWFAVSVLHSWTVPPLLLKAMTPPIPVVNSRGRMPSKLTTCRLPRPTTSTTISKPETSQLTTSKTTPPRILGGRLNRLARPV